MRVHMVQHVEEIADRQNGGHHAAHDPP
jgi:hypothetical protein